MVKKILDTRHTGTLRDLYTLFYSSDEFGDFCAAHPEIKRFNVKVHVTATPDGVEGEPSMKFEDQGFSIPNPSCRK